MIVVVRYATFKSAQEQVLGQLSRRVRAAPQDRDAASLGGALMRHPVFDNFFAAGFSAVTLVFSC